MSHGRYIAFQTAEVAIPKDLFADILRSRTYWIFAHFESTIEAARACVAMAL
jgi:hypothetical protein